MTTITNDEPALIITDAAALKIRELLNEEGDPNLKLRISISGGGCSGFQYNFSFDEVVNDDDTIVERTVP
jgi:iron-sulfur cluster insertion protein